MSEIPDDILSAAAAVVDRGYDTGLIDAVAAALMAERNRCMKAICSGCASGLPLNELGYHQFRSVSVTYPCHATAIRTPSTGEEQ